MKQEYQTDFNTEQCELEDDNGNEGNIYRAESESVDDENGYVMEDQYRTYSEGGSDNLSTVVFPTLYVCLCQSACLYICLFVCIFICIPASLYVCMPACLSVYLSVGLPVCLVVYLPACLSVCLFVCWAVCLPICLLGCLFGDLYFLNCCEHSLLLHHYTLLIF